MIRIPNAGCLQDDFLPPTIQELIPFRQDEGNDQIPELLREAKQLPITNC
jgi:hypothetical protein